MKPDWKPIETIPEEEVVLLWWVGNQTVSPDKKAPPTCVMGQSAYEDDSMIFTSAGSLLPKSYYSHWAPLPAGPSKGD